MLVGLRDGRRVRGVWGHNDRGAGGSELENDGLKAIHNDLLYSAFPRDNLSYSPRSEVFEVAQ